MTFQAVNFGAASDGSQGDSTRTGFTKANANFVDIYAQLGSLAMPADVSWVPAVTAASGTYNKVVTDGIYVKMGRMVYITLTASIVDVGSGVGSPQVSLPLPSGSASIITGRENAVTGAAIEGITEGNLMPVWAYNNLSPVSGNGAQLVMAGWYVTTA